MTEPMYRQIAEELQRQIESGELARGSQLPTEIELREEYGASRNTVRDAIKWLTTRGLVETRPGQGTFVTEKIDPFVTTLSGPVDSGGGEEEVYLAEVVASRRKPRISAPSGGDPAGLAGGGRSPADRAWLAGGEQASATVHRRHPVVAANVFLPDVAWWHRARAGSSRRPTSRAGWWPTSTASAASSRPPTGTPSRCGPPNENEAAFFKLPADGRVAVFTVFRVGYDQDGQRFRLTITVYPTDRNRLLYNQGPVPPPPTAEEIR